MRYVIVILALFAIALSLGAQAPTVPQFSASLPQGTLASCPTPVAGYNSLCSVTDGIYVAVGTGSYVKIGTGSAGVTTFNGRSGPVTLTKADVTGSGVTVTTTASSTLQ